jgi:hypothetical protein
LSEARDERSAVAGWGDSVTSPPSLYFDEIERNSSAFLFALVFIIIIFNLAADYQDYIPYSSSLPLSGLIFINALFRI